MYLGGGYHGNRLNKLYRSSIMEDEILEIMRPMIKKFAAEREPGEHFGDWTIRVSLPTECLRFALIDFQYRRASSWLPKKDETFTITQQKWRKMRNNRQHQNKGNQH